MTTYVAVIGGCRRRWLGPYGAGMGLTMGLNNRRGPTPAVRRGSIPLGTDLGLIAQFPLDTHL